MLFRTFEHYNDEIITENKINMECFICYDIQLENKIYTIELKNQEDYIKLCSCNGWVHKECLNEWYDKSQKCPICRQFTTKKTNISVTLKNYNSIFLFYMYFLKNFYMHKIVLFRPY